MDLWYGMRLLSSLSVGEGGMNKCSENIEDKRPLITYMRKKYLKYLGVS